MKVLARALIVIGLITVVPVTAADAGAGHAVGPEQYFTGVINGVDGNTAKPITIHMVCHAPLTPGETGHPAAGQTVAVHQLFPPAASASARLGYTGTGSEIGAFFNAPPPAEPPGTNSSARTHIFTRYDKSQRLAISVVLPCSGKGIVWFTPIPVVPPSRSATIPVRYVSSP